MCKSISNHHWSERTINEKIKYNLLDNAFSSKDLKEGIKVLKSGQITMSKRHQILRIFGGKKK